MEFKPKEEPTGQPPVDPFAEQPKDSEEKEVDLETYFGDPDGGDNIVDHGTPRPKEEPAGEPTEEPAGEPAGKPEPVAETPEDKGVKPEEPHEEPPASETYKIKVQGEEMELTRDQLIELAQKGEDYTRKTQALSEREKRLTGYEGLVNLVNRDPNFRQYLQTYDPQAAAQPVPPHPVPVEEPKVDDTPPEDPVERVKWEAARDTMKQVQPIIDNLRQELDTVKKSVTQVTPQVRRQVDPLGEVTHKAMLGYLESLPPNAAKALYNTWDTDADAYQEAYNWMREMVAAKYQERQEQEPPAGEPPVGEPPVGQPPVGQPPAGTPPAGTVPAGEPLVTPPGAKQVVKTERAPLLEATGAATVESNVADKAKKVKQLHSRIKNQEYDPRDVGKLFDLIDPLD